MGKHFSKGKLCQLELNADPKRGDSRSWREPSRIHPSHHLLASISARGQRGTDVPAHLHIPMPRPGLPAPEDRSIIHTTFFCFSSYSTALWRPSLPFGEIRIKQNALQTQRCGGCFWTWEERVHCGPITTSWGYHSPSTAWPLQLNTQDLPRKPHLDHPTAHHSLHCGLLGPLWSLLFASRLPRAAYYFH